MSRKQYTGPRLPVDILKQVDPITGGQKKSRHSQSRKDQRRSEREEKKQNRSRSHVQHNRRNDDRQSREDGSKQQSTTKALTVSEPRNVKKPLKSILKRPVQHVSESENEEDNSFSEFDEEEEVTQPRAGKKHFREDDEIAALEKKLGIKGKRSKALEDDGLDWLAGGSDSEGSFTVGIKRKRVEDEEWLRSKRLQTSEKTKSKSKVIAAQDELFDEDDSDGSQDEEMEATDEDEDDAQDEEEADSDIEGLQNPFSDDELSSDDLLSDDELRKPVQRKPRENPYVAPVSASTTKYIPPSMRKAVLDSAEDLTALKRQIQGQLNRLSEPNFLSILDAIQSIAEKNPRQHVFTVLTDLLHGLIASPSTLNETFLILHAGFTTAIFKVMGVELGATLLEKIVESITAFRARNAPGKEVLNLMGFLSNLYVLQMVGATIIFDYIRQLLESLSEDNTELLLRIIRTAGIQLRQDDPSSLKDIVVLLTRSVAAQGEQNLSIRTKYMIETITDLKNNRMKTGVNANAIVSEHTVRVKKIVGSLNTRTLRASEPLQISLKDIQDSEKKGKWWLVGASYLDPAKMNQDQAKSTSTAAIDDGYESETPGHVNLTRLARSQGMNTDVRRAIFIAIMSATDFRDAHVRVTKLNLKNKQSVEIPRVLLQCAGAEQVYNPYYTIIAEKLCGEVKLQKSFRSALWDILRKMKSGGELSEDISTPEIVNTARLFGTLMAAQQIQISALKTVDFTYLEGPLLTFIEVLLTSMLIRIDKLYKDKSELKIKDVFAKASTASGMIQGLRLFLENTISKAEIASSPQEAKIVRRSSIIAMRALDQAATAGHRDDDDSDDSSD